MLVPRRSSTKLTHHLLCSAGELTKVLVRVGDQNSVICLGMLDQVSSCLIRGGVRLAESQRFGIDSTMFQCLPVDSPGPPRLSRHSDHIGYQGRVKRGASYSCPLRLAMGRVANSRRITHQKTSLCWVGSRPNVKARS